MIERDLETGATSVDELRLSRDPITAIQNVIERQSAEIEMKNPRKKFPKDGAKEENDGRDLAK